MNKFIINAGQSLIEIVVAIGIIALVLVGVSDLITRSLGLSKYLESKNIAENIAQNQLNYYRQIRHQKPTDFFLNAQADYSSCVGNIDSKYTCIITYTDIGNGLNMRVIINWMDGDKQISTELSQILAMPTK